jgi:Tol biopolymer transport system component
MIRNACLCLLPTLLAGPLAAQATTERASVSTSGTQGNLDSSTCSLSGDGRFVAFESNAGNLVAGDTNATTDIFVRDRASGTTERVSVDSNGVEGNWYSLAPSISADGRFVAFDSRASNLVAGDTNVKKDVFVHDRLTGITERVSVDSAGAEANGDSLNAAISADGRFVAFGSEATNLAPGDTNFTRDIFVHDRQTGTTERVSISTAGAQPNQPCFNPVLSADGRYVAFASMASTLVLGDTTGLADVFLRDRWLGTTELVSLTSSGAQAAGNSYLPSISADGRCVAFESTATNFDSNDTNLTADIYLRDRQTGITERVSVATGGSSANSQSHSPSISADGRYVSFDSFASNLVAGDTNGDFDVFLHDRLAGTTERVSVDSAGQQGLGYSQTAQISRDGRCVVFVSEVTTLVPGDTNGRDDVFVRDLGTLVPGTDLCQAGTGSVSACPCGNPPANAPRGCDNSSATGGAQLTSSGTASLSFDSLVFATNGEKPTATSVVLQGNTEVSNGLVFGQGVRCAGGVLKRLYVQGASGGSIQAPGLGEPSVSARSAELGDPIGPGTNRWYAVYYRDPIVLGGCPAASTFNVTQTQLVSWTP